MHSQFLKILGLHVGINMQSAAYMKPLLKGKHCSVIHVVAHQKLNCHTKTKNKNNSAMHKPNTRALLTVPNCLFFLCITYQL